MTHISSQLIYRNSMIMLGSAGTDGGGYDELFVQPAAAGAVTQALCVLVTDVDAHCTRARDAGTEIVMEPAAVYSRRRVPSAVAGALTRRRLGSAWGRRWPMRSRVGFSATRERRARAAFLRDHARRT